MAIKHATKRVFTRVSTRKKTISKGLNQEFVDSRRRLEDISSSMKQLIKSIHSNRQVWTEVAKHQRLFSKTLSASFPQSGHVQDHAKEVELDLRNVQELINNDNDDQSAHQQILKILQEYLQQIESIETEYKDVEMSFTEKTRYERKVDKLERKKDNDKKASKLTRNIQKMSDAQKDLDSQIDKILIKMRVVFNKHEAVLQCAHHAYWMANNVYLNTIEKSTHNIRLESIAVHDRLLSIDVKQDTNLLPIPRVNLIEEIDGQTNQQSSVTVVVDPATTTTTTTQAATSVVSPTQTPVVQQMPTVTSENGTDLNIPELPTELPKPPPNATGKTSTVTTITSDEPSTIAA